MLHASLTPYLAVSAAMLTIGLYGLLVRKNLITLLISLELILNSASLNFMAFNRFCFTDKAAGQSFSLFIIALAAAEVCIGLSLILLIYRRQGSIDPDKARELRG